jgi:cell wall-associated NlpC family hydrolase
MLRLTTLILLALALSFSRAAGAEDAAPPLAGGEPLFETISRVPAVPQAPTPKPVPLGLRAVRYARRFLGIRYTWGGRSPRTGFDCSGLVSYVYAHFGIRLPRISYAQFGSGRRVARNRLRPGDLVFFDGAGHVGIYAGNGRFIHAPHTGTVVQLSRLRGPYGRGYDGARRVA